MAAAMVSFTGAAAVVLAARAAGILEGTWVVVLFLLLLFTFPFARTLSGRLVVSGTILLGLTPLLWWISFDGWGLGRAAFLLAVLVGLWAARLVVSRDRLRLLPRVAAVDVMPIMAGAIGAMAQWQMLAVRDGETALSLAVLHWDHASHYTMYSMIRTHGVVIPLLGDAPDGGAWSFRDYPQGFHALIAGLAEMARTPLLNDPRAELISYANYSSLVAVLTGLLAVAAVCSIQALRQRPAFGVPVAALVTAAWVLGPGAAASLNGFSNFLVAGCLASVAVVYMAETDRPLAPSTVWVLGACAVGVANNWIMLGVFVAGGAVALFYPPHRAIPSLPRTRGGVFSLVSAVVVSAAGIAVAVGQLVRVEAEDVVFGIGGVPIPDFGQLSVVILACAATLLIRTRDHGAHERERNHRRALAGLSVGAGLVLAIAMAAAQLAKNGTISYYAHKLLIALTLITVVVLALGIARLARSRGTGGDAPSGDRSRGSRASSAGVTLLTSVAAYFTFGFPFPLKDAGLPPTAHAGVEVQTQLDELAEPRDVAARLLQATEGRVGSPAMYLTTRPTAIDAILAKQWYDALTSTYTERGWKLSLNMFPLSGGPDHLPGVVADIRNEDPTAQFVVDPEDEALLEAALVP